MENINAISECKPQNIYNSNYSNQQTFNGRAKVSLDTPVDTYTKRNNKHKTLTVVLGVIGGLAAVAGIGYLGGIACLAKLKKVSWKEARAMMHREAKAATNFIWNYTNSKLLKNVDGVIMYDGKPFTGKTNILGMALPESISKSNKGLRIVQNIKNGKIKSVAILDPDDTAQYMVAKLSKSADTFKLKSAMTVDSKETADALKAFLKDKLLPEAQKYM